ncbi:MAG: sulfotransferase family protein [Planctomycetota bacterium]
MSPQPAQCVVVSGMPRSGTSLVMQMLSAAGVPAVVDAHRPADPDNPRGYFEHQAVKALGQDPSRFAGLDLAGKAVKVVSPLLAKLPAGPRYAVVFVERSPSEMLASQQKMLARLGRTGGALSEEKMTAVLTAQHNKAVALAEGRADMAVHRLAYRGCIDQPDEVAQELAAFVGGFLRRDLDATAMASAVDPDLYRNRA